MAEEKERESFFKSTTLHGARDVYQAHKTNHRFWTAFWLLVVILMIIATCIGCYLIVIGYINAPNVTTVQRVSVDEMSLPDVAICYMGGANVTRLREAGKPGVGKTYDEPEQSELSFKCLILKGQIRLQKPITCSELEVQGKIKINCNQEGEGGGVERKSRDAFFPPTPHHDLLWSFGP